MIYKCETNSPIIFDRFDQGDIKSAEVGLLRASLPTLGEGMVGGMSLRSKRAAVCGEPAAASCASTLSVSSLVAASPSKSAATNGTSVSIKSVAVAVPKKHGPYVVDKGHMITWIDAMRSQSPPQFRSLHGEAPETFDIETAAYSAWLVSIFTARDLRYELALQKDAFLFKKNLASVFSWLYNVINKRISILEVDNVLLTLMK